MRLPACLLLLCSAGPALAQQVQQKLAHDFRGARFDAGYFRYGGTTPEKFWKLEAEGLRLQFTGGDVPPTNNPSNVFWTFHARGNLVVTAQYEVLKNEPPVKGTFLAGVELYMKLDNPYHDSVMVARGVYPNGKTAFDFKILTNDGKGKRITRDFKMHPTTEKSLRGRLRLARKGTIVTAAFAEGDETKFTEFQRSDIGTADVQLVRFGGIAGGDRQAVLDMRLLEFQLEGDELALAGRFQTPLKTEVAKAKEVPADKTEAPPPVSEKVARTDIVPPAPEPESTGKRTMLPLALALVLVVIALLVAVGLLARRRKSVDRADSK